MSKPGYLIASTIRSGSYFTSRSAYDKPEWVKLKEATTYMTADIAETAMKKLIKNGAYAVRLVSLDEAMSFEFPDETKDVAPQDEMVAGHQEEVCPECEHEPCTCDMGEHQPGEEIDVDSLDLPPEEIVSRTSALQPGHTVSYKGQEFVVVGDAGNGTMQIAQTNDPKKITSVHVNELLPVHEAAKPKRQSGHQKEVAAANKRYQKELDKQRAEYEAKHGETYHYGAAKVVKLPVKESTDVAADCCAKIEVPAAAKSELAAVISKYEKEAKDYDGRDDARAAFCATTAEAMATLQTLLNGGTVADIKQAQIALSTMMNPITSNIPASVLKFINSGGRKPSLKDLFNDKRTFNKDNQ